MDVAMYGWYSAQSAEHGNGTAFWADIDGNEVEVTEVTKTPDTNCLWPDNVCVGMVFRYLRQGKPGDRQMEMDRQAEIDLAVVRSFWNRRQRF